jgi:pimeloyl-ACP methyl ester carboxylesterase
MATSLDAHLAARVSSKPRIGSFLMDERFIEIRGQTLRYLVCGQGKPLVLCHGFLSSAEEFGGRFSQLGEHRTLIIPDLPGNGASPPLRGRHTSAAMADLVFDLLNELAIERFDVGGLCLGATVACALAKRAGERAERLVLHTPLLSPDLMRRRYREQVRLLSRRPMWDAVVWLSRQRRISDLYKRFVIVEGDVDNRTADVNYENQRRADPRAAREWLNDCLRRDDVDVVAARAEATLIIVARHDRLVDVERLKGLIAQLPDLHVFTDTDQGHGWNEAAVRRQLEVLRDFFNGATNGNGAGGQNGSNGHIGSNGHSGHNGHGANGAIPGSLVPSLRDTVGVTLAPR